MVNHPVRRSIELDSSPRVMKTLYTGLHVRGIDAVCSGRLEPMVSPQLILTAVEGVVLLKSGRTSTDVVDTDGVGCRT